MARMQTKLGAVAARLALAAVLGGLSASAAAHKLTLRECIEGSDFIRNAAMSRDNGITRDVFIDRLEGDLRAIKLYPPQMRWFVQDSEDEALLMQAAQGVFDSPRAPEVHQSDFMSACVAKVGAARTDAGLAGLDAPNLHAAEVAALEKDGLPAILLDDGPVRIHRRNFRRRVS